MEFGRSADGGDVHDDDAYMTSDKVSFIESPLVPNTLNSNNNNSDEMNDNNIIDTSAPAPAQSPPPTPQTQSEIELEIESLSNSDIGKDSSNDNDSMNQSSSSTICTEKERGQSIAKFNNTKKQCRTSPPPVANKKGRT